MERGREKGEGRQRGQREGGGCSNKQYITIREVAGPHMLRAVMILFSSSQSCLIYQEALFLSAGECGFCKVSTNCVLGEQTNRFELLE